VRHGDHGPPAGVAKRALELHSDGDPTENPPRKPVARTAAALLAAALPLIGLVSLLLRSELDPHFENYRAHFVVFGIVGGVACILGCTAVEAANRRVL
jgi:hypothetical protein